MARNKHPELTIARIVDASLRLFLKKGYENTSIQDILNEMGGLTKGAIYHHFRSKEEILLAVMNQLLQDQDVEWKTVRTRSDLNGAEKLREVFLISMSNAGQMKFFRTAPDLLENPKILTLMLKSIMEETAPQYVLPLIEEGVADGSIRTQYPQQMAETILLLINVWAAPLVFFAPLQEIEQRCRFFDELFRESGLQFYEGKIKEQFEKLYRIYAEKQ